MIEDRDFNEYIEAFKKLPLKKKQDLTIKEIIELFAFINKLQNDLNLNNNVLYNKEIEDLNNETATEDDFVEAVYVYIYSLKEYLADYIEKISSLIYKESD